MTLSTPDKAILRKRLRAARAAVGVTTRRRAARVAVRFALRQHLLSSRRRLGFYFPAKAEFDCMPLLERALTMGAECYLPVVPRARQRRMWFSRLGPDEHWRVNRYGIPEYGHRRSARVRLSAVDVLFLPLLGFDLAGYRMGMGGGYYDASLAYLRLRRSWRKPLRVGLAFEAQKVERLPVDPWDIPLDVVITERRIYRFSSGNG